MYTVYYSIFEEKMKNDIFVSSSYCSYGQSEILNILNILLRTSSNQFIQYETQKADALTSIAFIWNRWINYWANLSIRNERYC